MVKEITVRKTGGSVSVTIPREMTARFRIEAGDQVFAIETDHGILLTPYDPTFAKAMAAYDSVARRYRNALASLAG